MTPTYKAYWIGDTDTLPTGTIGYYYLDRGQPTFEPAKSKGLPNVAYEVTFSDIVVLEEIAEKTVLEPEVITLSPRAASLQAFCRDEKHRNLITAYLESMLERDHIHAKLLAARQAAHQANKEVREHLEALEKALYQAGLDPLELTWRHRLTNPTLRNAC